MENLFKSIHELYDYKIDFEYYNIQDNQIIIKSSINENKEIVQIKDRNYLSLKFFYPDKPYDLQTQLKAIHNEQNIIILNYNEFLKTLDNYIIKNNQNREKIINIINIIDKKNYPYDKFSNFNFILNYYKILNSYNLLDIESNDLCLDLDLENIFYVSNLNNFEKQFQKLLNNYLNKHKGPSFDLLPFYKNILTKKQLSASLYRLFDKPFDENDLDKKFNISTKIILENIDENFKTKSNVETVDITLLKINVLEKAINNYSLNEKNINKFFNSINSFLENKNIYILKHELVDNYIFKIYLQNFSSLNDNTLLQFIEDIFSLDFFVYNDEKKNQLEIIYQQHLFSDILCIQNNSKNIKKI